MRSLDNIGCKLGDRQPSKGVGTPFLRALIDTAVISVLRGLKHNARIPVPQAWNLVGVADEDGTLGPGEIYGANHVLCLLLYRVYSTLVSLCLGTRDGKTNFSGGPCHDIT